jgi:hypothetical protein
VGSADKDAAGGAIPSELPTTHYPLPTALKALAEDGQAYRAWLRGELARLAGIVRAEAEAGLLLSALEGQPVAKWLPVIASFQARVEALLPAAPHGRWPSPPDPLSQDWERGNRTGERVVRPVRLA